MPTPVTITTSSGVATAAWNQRNAFQNQARVVSFDQPGGGDRAGRDQHHQGRVPGQDHQQVPDRGDPHQQAHQAQHGREAGVGDLLGVERLVHGCHEFQDVTPISDSITARVSPPTAAVTATV